MNKLSDMINIGKTLENKLKDVEINTPQELIDMGSKEAYLRIKMVDRGACYNMLCALEGAIQGVRWKYLDDEEKKKLKGFYESLK